MPVCYALFYSLLGLEVSLIVLKEVYYRKGIKIVKAFHDLLDGRKCKSKQYGGLHVLSIKEMNMAFLARWIWKFVMFPEFQWCCLIHSQYYVERILRKVSESNSGISQFWKGVKVGPGNLVSFWQDNWCGEDSLVLQFPTLYSLSMNKDTSVAHMRNIYNERLGIYNSDEI